MKRFKFAFLALIAIAAMSFTIAEKNGAFASKKKAVTDCFRPNTLTPQLKVKNPANCVAAEELLTATVQCNTIQAYQTNQYKIWSLDPAFVYTQSQISTQCPGSGAFCCLTVVEDSSPCPSQPTFDIGAGLKAYKVSQIKCRL